MTPSIKELKAELIEGSVPLSILLRKSVLIARTIKDSETEQWISRELNGYQEGDEAPTYRILSGQPLFLNPYRGWQVLLVEGDNRDFARLVNSVPTFSPISEVEQLSQEKDIKLQYGHDLERIIQSRTNLPGKPALGVSSMQFQNILTTVRNKLLDWVSGLPDESMTANAVTITTPDQNKTMDFAFISDDRFRTILERDYAELQALSPEVHPKSVLILAGGIIEGLLIDALVKSGYWDEKTTFEKFLKELIYPAKAKGIIIHDNITEVLRVFRNLVHPAREIRDKLSFTAEHAKHARTSVDVVIAEVRRWQASIP
jgi:AbiTii